MTASVLVAVRVEASPEQAFEVFTREISQWWRPGPLFQITPRGDGVLSFDGGAGGRVIATLSTGMVFEVGRITVWEPGRRLAFTWRHATFGPRMSTRVEVAFEPVERGARVSVTHFGWTDIPVDHAARHGFPDRATQARVAEWWAESLDAYRRRAPDHG